MLKFDLTSLLDKGYLDSKFEENIKLTVIISWGIIFLAIGLWVLDWSIDRIHAEQTIGLRLLMGVVASAYPLAVFFRLRRELLAIVITGAALGCQLIFSEILNRLDHGVSNGVGGYLYFFISFTLISLLLSIRASAVIIVILALAPPLTSQFGIPAGMSMSLYAAYVVPVSAIIIFTCYVIDVFSLRNYRTQSEIKLLSETDELTGLSNRRYLFQQGRQFLSLAKRHHRPFSLLAIDLDFFKRLNDAYGHPAGDAALRHASAVFSKNLRQSDSIGRTGGEEFIVLLPDTDLAGAAEKANRLVAALFKTPCKWPQAPDGNIQMSASIGVASVASVEGVNEGDALETLLLHGDQALYEAKNCGRNCVRAWGKASLQESKDREH